MPDQPCPCQSGLTYAECCRPPHQGAPADHAEKLMRSRYTAYVLRDIAYIIQTTVPAQQPLLDAAALAQWAEQTEWLGLDILRHEPNAGKHHALVEFAAYFAGQGGVRETHRERSAFVTINGRWYFIDPTVPPPSMKSACICGSGKKYKHCCGKWSDD
ncbi:MAG: YchJ family protein [Neisseria sp.]|nr:YchJ family protein [Neisseria sp.]